METIKTQRHFLRFYIYVIFIFLFFSALGGITFYAIAQGRPTELLEPKFFLGLIFSTILIFISFLFIYSYFKQSPTIAIDPLRKTIKFGSKTYFLNDIKDVKLTGKVPFGFIFNDAKEGASIHFMNGEKRYIYDDVYSNSWQIKKFIAQVVLKEADILEMEAQSIDKNRLCFENEELFKGNLLLSFRGISLWGLIGFFFGIAILKMKSPHIEAVIIILSLCLFWFMGHSRFLHYFGLIKDYFIIGNHNYFWMRKIYRINEIKEVVYESQGKQPNCLRIITKDFKSKLYPAGTLREKTWLHMKEKLEKAGVEVRNECIHDKNAV